MDSDLYDEFGNYVGPELESDDEDNDDVPVGGEVSGGEEDHDEQVLFSCCLVGIECNILVRLINNIIDCLNINETCE